MSTVGRGVISGSYVSDDETGIKYMDNCPVTLQDNIIYNLQGQRVTTMQPNHIYIVDGKKVLFK